MPYFIVKRIRSQDEELTLVESDGFGTRNAAEAAAKNRLTPPGLVVDLAVVEAATAAEALNQDSRVGTDAD